MGSDLNLSIDGFDEGGMGMAQHKGTMPPKVIDIFITVHVPFVAALGSVEIDWERQHKPPIMGNSPREDPARMVK
jgi:hypothetical protein